MPRRWAVADCRAGKGQSLCRAGGGGTPGSYARGSAARWGGEAAFARAGRTEASPPRSRQRPAPNRHISSFPHGQIGVGRAPARAFARTSHDDHGLSRRLAPPARRPLKFLPCRSPKLVSCRSPKLLPSRACPNASAGIRRGPVSGCWRAGARQPGMRSGAGVWQQHGFQPGRGRYIKNRRISTICPPVGGFRRQLYVLNGIGFIACGG